ncbi:MAG: BrnT family toxin [Woeseiaceae bacterium]|nr:BrnT family toxin [Woeseiaceae bacterium]
MPELTFEWNSRKAAENRRKHRVSFEEAKSAFLDENARVIADSEHADHEDRFILLGLSIQLRLFVVVHCYRESENVIRIISARKADPSERRQYSEFVS